MLTSKFAKLSKNHEHLSQDEASGCRRKHWQGRRGSDNWDEHRLAGISRIAVMFLDKSAARSQDLRNRSSICFPTLCPTSVSPAVLQGSIQPETFTPDASATGSTSFR